MRIQVEGELEKHKDTSESEPIQKSQINIFLRERFMDILSKIMMKHTYLQKLLMGVWRVGGQERESICPLEILENKKNTRKIQDKKLHGEFNILLFKILLLLVCYLLEQELESSGTSSKFVDKPVHYLCVLVVLFVTLSVLSLLWFLKWITQNVFFTLIQVL